MLTIIIRKAAVALGVLTIIAMPLVEKSAFTTGIVLAAVLAVVMLVYVTECWKQVIVHERTAHGQIRNFVWLLMPIALIAFAVDAACGIFGFVFWFAMAAVLMGLKGVGIGNLHKGIGSLCAKLPGG